MSAMLVRLVLRCKGMSASNSLFSRLIVFICTSRFIALEKYGFVVELGSNTLSELHNTMFSSVRELFEFPTETKMKVTYERPFHGYSSLPPFKRMMIDNATSTDVTQKLTNIFWHNGNDLYR
ncbi:hypothetical protein SO802_022242 [Lithocarpus litseifolius]|uniref:Non-haem dioxygenase N-terminal domain-containing protein n=1 Tax=Lithocarpus litseifolius TaxID=425828 RepID=A0AAW2CID4_9ROSI